MTLHTQKQKPLQFVAWDGEGVNDKYILLRNSRGNSIFAVNGLSTAQCLQFIMEQSRTISQSIRSIHVIYGGSYDVNMLLCDLSREHIFRLWHTGSVDWQGYRLRYIHRKSFTISVEQPANDRHIRDAQSNSIQAKTSHTKSTRSASRRSYVQSITLWDVIGFFQSTFVTTIKQWLPHFDQQLLDNIIAHKADRSTFRPEQFDEIDAYCKQEIDALVQIMEKLNEALHTAGLTISRWDGAGAIAQALLRKYRVKEHQRDFSTGNTIERQVHSAAWKAYAGGRIECLQYGHTLNSVWHGDINSAYPTATLTLPSFQMGSWHSCYGFTSGMFGVYHVSFEFGQYVDSSPFFPFFYRDPEGKICYPEYGQGWYWQPEVEVALKWMPEGVTIEEGYVWIPTEATNPTDADTKYNDNDNPVPSVLPFQFVEEVYRQRREYKKMGNAAQMVLKLGMNSLYGKLAQQVGYKKNKKPTFQQIEWAGWITSETRAKLFDVGMQHPHSVIMFATDGVFSTSVHDVSSGSALGEWETHTHDEMVIAQSGVYWYRDNGSWTDKFRGFDREELTWEKVLEAFQALSWTLTVPSTRFITMGGALQSHEAWTSWRTWPEKQRTLLLLASGTKRGDVNPFWSQMDNPSLRLFQTTPLINEYAILGIESQPYKKTDRTILEKRLDREEQDGFV